MGTSKAQASQYGTAAGTAIGAMFGPAGMAVGGALGGAVGGMLGSDPKAPPPVALPPPQMPGGTSGIYQGWTIDPVTGRMVYYDNSLSGTYSAQDYQTQQLRDAMLGGNSAQIGLQAQIQAAQQLVDRLSKQTGANGEPSGPAASDFVSEEWIGKDGKILRPADVGSSSEHQGLFKLFMANTQNGNYGKGSLEEKFKRWVADAYRNNIEAKVKEYENALKTNKGNVQTAGEGLDAAKLRLQQLQAIQQGGGPDLNNPILNYLNQRNTGEKPDYLKKYADPWTGKMSDEADYQLGRSKENINFQDLAAQLGIGTDPGIPDAKKFTADMLAQYGGAMGGERMQGIGPYDSSKLGQWLASQNRVASNRGAAALRGAESMAAKRGMLGSSVNDSSRLDAQMALQDALSENAAKTYSMDAQDQDLWFKRKFAIDQHNSDVARQAAQGKASLAAQGFGNEMAAKQLYEQIMGNRFNMNNSEQQRAFQNMLAALGQRTSLDQRTIDNARYEENQDRQNFADRMGFLGYLSGERQQGFNEQMGRNSAGMSQNQLGAQVGLTTTGWQNDYNAANVAQQNAYNMGQFNMDQASQAADAGRWNTLALALGQLLGKSNNDTAAVTPPTQDQMGSIPTTTRATPNLVMPEAAGPTQPTPIYSLAKPPSQSSYTPNTNGLFVGRPR